MEWRKLSTFVGAVLLNFGLGYPLYVGNLTVYTSSYALARNVPGAHTTSIWLLASFNVCRTICVLSASFVSNKIGKRATIGLGLVLFCVGNFASYYTITCHVAWFILTSACLSGLTAGLAMAVSLRFLVSWERKKVGTVTSLVPVSYSIGGGCINIFITRFINPDNRKPMASHGTIDYFDQAEVLDRVPAVFLCLGAMAFGSQVLGLIMLRECPMKTEAAKSYGTLPGNDAVSTEANERVADANGQTNQEAGCSHEDRSSEDVVESYENVEPKRLFKTRSFYAVCIMYMAAQAMSISFLSSYKIFGETAIGDDTFLTEMAVVMSMSVIASRLLCGFLIDRTRTRNLAMAFYLVPGLCCAWLYLSAVYNKWTYFFCGITIGCCVSTRQVFFPSLILKYFGKKHFTTNLGVAMCSTIIVSLILPELLPVIIECVGWSMFYSFPYLCALLASVSIFVGLRDK